MGDLVIAAQNQERRKKVLYVLTMPDLPAKWYWESVSCLEFYDALNVMRESANIFAAGLEELLRKRIMGDLVG